MKPITCRDLSVPTIVTPFTLGVSISLLNFEFNQYIDSICFAYKHLTLTLMKGLKTYFIHYFNTFFLADIQKIVSTNPCIAPVNG